ncbi:hypothetical protein Pcinc_035259 [Petrolisthes cinctipes]|uniref:G-protein coupled receptors family 1 profile domain-containing protein n=1 Tax=Petrolisthes cinctipes TaxID=88211 RepID=A0AAE1BX24_PETCI|nr:hypothetical protein Pcinc_035259 [Petrolisthes cinctipes]
MATNNPTLVTLEEAASSSEPTLLMDDTVYYYNYSSYDDSCMNYNISSNNTILEEAPELTTRFLIGLLLMFVGILGMLGNIVSITVLSRPKMRSSINCCLIGLTSFDLIVVTTSILMFGLQDVSDYTDKMSWYTHGVFPRVTPIIFPLALIAQTGSVYLTVTVTVERYIAVCQPLKARFLCTYGRARTYVLCVALFSFLYNLPRFWEVTYTECIISEEIWFGTVDATDLRRNEYYVSIYIMWMYLFVMYLIPFLSLIIFNYFIYKRVRQANEERQQLTRLQKKEIGLAVMLLVVVSVFFLCNLLAFIINLLEMMGIEINELTLTSNLLVTINSSVNFIIYCIFGQKFRRMVLKMFCGSFLGSTGAARDLAGQDSGAYGNSVYGESRGVTNGKTQTFRLSSWDGSHTHQAGGGGGGGGGGEGGGGGSGGGGCGGSGGRLLHHPHDHNHGHHHHNHHGFSWRSSRYTSVPLGDSGDSSRRTSGSLYTSQQTQSLLPQQNPSENVHVL